MSTRCEIIIKDYETDKKTGKKHKWKVTLYHHCDGYPNGVGRFLMDTVYPKLVSSNNADIDVIANLLIKNREDTGFELTCYKHVDIQYRYIIDIPKKEIMCYEGQYDSWESDNSRFKATGKENLLHFLPLKIAETYA